MSYPTVRDIAQKAHVSIGTVSNVLNRPHRVSPDTRKRVQDVIDILGFVPSRAHSLEANNSKLVGLLISTNDPFHDELTMGIEDALAFEDFNLVVGITRENVTRRTQVLNAMIEANIRGVIVATSSENFAPLNELISRHVRAGVVDLTDETPNHCSVSVDQVQGGYLGIEYLASLGHKKVLWLSGPPAHLQSNQRLLGVQQAARKFDIEVSTITSPGLDFISGEQIAKDIVDLGPLPDSIFCCNDAQALGVMNYFFKVGIKVPEDVSILGFDNVAYAESALVPLSTVSQTPYQLGYTMGQQLLTEFSAGSDHAHQRAVFQPTIVERASTRAI